MHTLISLHLNGISVYTKGKEQSPWTAQIRKQNVKDADSKSLNRHEAASLCFALLGRKCRRGSAGSEQPPFQHLLSPLWLRQ